MLQVKKLMSMLILAAFFNGVVWIALTPIWQAPDEQAHFAQVQDFAELGYKPLILDTSFEIFLSERILGTERNSNGNNNFTYNPSYTISYSEQLSGKYEGVFDNLPVSARTNFVKREATFNPPVYYILGSTAYHLFYDSNLFNRVTAVRFVSLLISMLSILFAYKIGKVIFTKNFLMPIALSAVVSFKPMLSSVSAGVLPDVLTNLLFTIIILISLLIIKYGLKIKYLILSLTIIFLGHSTRQQFLISALIIAPAILYQFLTNFDKYRKVSFLLSIIVAGLILDGALFQKIAVLNKFSILEIGRPNLSLLFSNEFLNHAVVFGKRTIAETLPWYWGVYKWLSLTLPAAVYQVINRIIILSVAGLTIWFYSMVKRNKLMLVDKFIIFLLYASFIYYAVFLVGDFYFEAMYGYSFGIQGRYFFPLVVAHLSLILFGFSKISKTIIGKYSKYLVILLVALMMVFNNFALWFISGSYYDTSSVHSFITQASQYKADFLKGNVILLLVSTSLLFQLIFISNLGVFTLRYSNEEN